jgi:hypothetical protein
MATTFRTVFKLIAGFFAVLPGASASAEPTRAAIVAGSEKLTMSEFIARLRQDPALRAQFLQNSRAVLREAGIDPTPFNLADRLDEKALARLLANWAADASPRPQLAQLSTKPSAPSGVVYGPPPGPRPSPRPRPPSDLQAAPSAPVYGPPPAPRPSPSPPDRQ